MADQPFLTAINGLIDKGVNAFQDFGLTVGQGNKNYNALQNVNNASMQAYLDDEQSYTPPAPSYPSNSDMQSYLDDSQQSYNSPSLFTDTEDDRFRQNAENLATIAASNSNSTNRNPTYNPTGGGGGGASTYSAPEAEAAYLSQDLSQRTPSGTQYAPDMSAYDDSSLFNYTGPGGVDGYTYGQGLRTDGADYSMFGTPTDMVNPYYEGQFADPVSTGVADSAVGMSPIVMPEGIPAIGGGSGTTQMPVMPRPGDSAADLTYAQQIAAMGLTPQTAPSTQFGTEVGSNTPSLFDRQLAEMSPERIAMMNSILDEQNRMQQGQTSSGTAPAMDDTLDVESGMQRAGNYGLTMPDMGNNYGVGGNFGSNSIFTGNGQDFYDDVTGGEFAARQNFLEPRTENMKALGIESNYENNFDLGRPGDPSYQEFVADPSKFTTNQRPDQGLAAQAMADQMMAGLTKEELRDGLFIEPNVSTGKMGIPDIFTQDKTPIEARDASLFDSGFEFDPEKPYAERGMTDGFLWEDNNGNFHKPWDDMGLIDVIPGMNDPEFLRGEALTESRNQALAAEQAKQDKIAADANQARAEQAQRQQEIYAREQMAAREEVVQRNIAEARAQAEEQARVAADRKGFQDRMAATRKDAARVPVFRPPTVPSTPKSSMGSGSSWSRSPFGGF